MNRHMVQPWVPPSVPSLPTCSWRSLKLRPSAPFHTPRLWLRFVDDTFVIIKAEHSQHLLHHINSQDPHIQFTVEEPSHHGTLPFLDTLVTIGPNHNLDTTVYRKPTHTDQHLHWDSKQFITAKQSIYNTLAHRAKIASHNQEKLNKELEHIKKGLHAFQFPPCALKQLQHRFNRKQNQDFNHNHNSTTTDNLNSNNHKNITTLVHYIQGIGERFKKACHSRGIQVHLKGTNTLKSLLVKPIEKESKLQKSGVIYHF